MTDKELLYCLSATIASLITDKGEWCRCGTDKNNVGVNLKNKIKIFWLKNKN